MEEEGVWILITEGLSEAIIGNDSGVSSVFCLVCIIQCYSNSDTRLHFSFDQGSSSREVTTEQPFQECLTPLPEEKPGLWHLPT
jgi:hypothetical protein